MLEHLLCRLEDKAELEARNGVDQLDYLTSLVEHDVRDLRESHVLQLQKLAVAGIYRCGGFYRSATREVFIQGSKHEVPPPSSVPSLVRDAVDWVNSERKNRSALERAAYALWRFNWIHPFAGGNGRTSRAVAYLILCATEGRMLPGVPSMPTLIYEERDAYIDALRAVDASQVSVDAESNENGEPDFGPMTAFVRKMLTKQFAAAIDGLDSPNSNR